MNKHRYKPDQVIAALTHTRGMVTLAAERLGCDVDTVYNYIKRYATVAAELKRQRERTTDIAELKLYQSITEGEAWAVQFYLKTQGKNRGYVERQELTGKDGNAIEVTDPFVHTLIRVWEYEHVEGRTNGYHLEALRPKPKTQAEAYGEIVSRCLWNPALFVEMVIGAQPDPWQVDVMRGLLDKRMAAIAGGNGAGKDALAAWIALWVLATRPYAKGQVTAPTKDQLYAIFWAELAKWIGQSPILSQLLEWQKTRVVWREHPERWFLVARTAKKSYSHTSDEAASEGLQGMHEDHAIVIITECSGVEDENWDAAESCCTGPDNYLLAVGNPLRRSGRFYDIFTRPAFQRDWYTRHVSYTESSHADNARHEGWIARYGEESAYCQVRCFGQFPKQGAPDTAIPWELVMDAMSRDAPLEASEDLQIGVDVAHMGGDEAAIAIRVGYAIPEIRTFQQSRGPDLVGQIMRAVRDYGGNQETLIMVDEAGLGGIGVVDPLVQTHGYRHVVGMSNSMTARDKARYESFDDEQWLEVLPPWLAVAQLPMDDILLAQLTTRKYQFTGKNEQQRRLESKASLRSRGLPSPDRAEAVMLACAQDTRRRWLPVGD